MFEVIRKLTGARRDIRPGRRASVRPRLEALEERWCPATIDWAGGTSGDWTLGANWAGGNAPGASDVAHFASGKPDCFIPAGSNISVGGLNMDSGYGNLTLNHNSLPAQDSTLTVTGTANMDGGTVIQQGANCTLTMTGGGTWDGTAFNYGTGTAKSTVTFDGTWTVKTGAQTMGSDMQVGDNTNTATMTWQTTTNPDTCRTPPT
jgi:hypothetical protein